MFQDFIRKIMGKTVFYLDAKSKEIRTGEVVGLQISTTGYCLVAILNTGKVMVESKHVYFTKAEAKAHKADVEFPIDESQRLITATTGTIDKLRKLVIGEPEYLSQSQRLQK